MKRMMVRTKYETGGRFGIKENFISFQTSQKLKLLIIMPPILSPNTHLAVPMFRLRSLVTRGLLSGRWSCMGSGSTRCLIQAAMFALPQVTWLML